MSIRLRLAAHLLGGCSCVLAALVVARRSTSALAHAVADAAVADRRQRLPARTPVGRRRQVEIDERRPSAVERRPTPRQAAHLLVRRAAGRSSSSSLGVGWLVAGYVLAPDRAHHRGGPRHPGHRPVRAASTCRVPTTSSTSSPTPSTTCSAGSTRPSTSQRQFIQEASHELRNPLAVIRTNLDVTLDRSRRDDRGPAPHRRGRRAVDRAHDPARRRPAALRPQRDAVARARAGRRRRRSCTRRPTSSARRPRPAGCHRVGAAARACCVTGDRNALRQALANLLANATRLAPTGTPVTGAGPVGEGPWVWMAVDDQGPGIAPDDQDRVFQRFWRGDAERAGGERRSGLGLTIVRQIAEAHGGEVKLVSALGPRLDLRDLAAGAGRRAGIARRPARPGATDPRRAPTSRHRRTTGTPPRSADALSGPRGLLGHAACLGCRRVWRRGESVATRSDRG